MGGNLFLRGMIWSGFFVRFRPCFKAIIYELRGSKKYNGIAATGIFRC